MTEIPRHVFDELVDLIEDSVEHACRRYALEGLSGEAAWKIVNAYSQVKELQYTEAIDERQLD